MSPACPHVDLGLRAWMTSSEERAPSRGRRQQHGVARAVGRWCAASRWQSQQRPPQTRSEALAPAGRSPDFGSFSRPSCRWSGLPSVLSTSLSGHISPGRLACRAWLVGHAECHTVLVAGQQAPSAAPLTPLPLLSVPLNWELEVPLASDTKAWKSFGLGPPTRRQVSQCPTVWDLGSPCQGSLVRGHRTASSRCST